MAIGFDTPSKRKAEAEASNSPQMDMMPSSQLHAEAVARFNSLTEMICSLQFASLPNEQKQMMMCDFAFYKNVAEAL